MDENFMFLLEPTLFASDHSHTYHFLAAFVKAPSLLDAASTLIQQWRPPRAGNVEATAVLQTPEQTATANIRSLICPISRISSLTQTNMILVRLPTIIICAPCGFELKDSLLIIRCDRCRSPSWQTRVGTSTKGDRNSGEWWMVPRPESAATRGHRH